MLHNLSDRLCGETLHNLTSSISYIFSARMSDSIRSSKCVPKTNDRYTIKMYHDITPGYFFLMSY